MGQIYVAPVARVTDNDTGIGGSGGGSEFAGGYLLWTYSGFTGVDWYWGQTPITAWWAEKHSTISSTGKIYENSAAGLGEYIQDEKITELNDAFKNWDPEDKFEFIYEKGLQKNCVDWTD